jgi:hypothetical protein
MALRDVLASFVVDVDDKKLKAADKAVDGLSSKLGNLTSLIGGALTIGAIKSFVGGMVDAADQINDTSAQLGISGRELQRWSYAAGLSGGSTQDVATAFKILEKNAAGGNKAFKDVGVSAADLKDGLNDPAALMHKVGEGIAGIKNPADRTKAALELLGRGGAKLIPVFSEGAEGVDKMLDELDDLGGGYSDSALAALDALGDDMHRLDTATTSLKSRIAVILVPAITKMVEVATKWTAALSRNKSAVQALMVVIGALGAVALAAGLSAAAPWLALAAAVAFAFLAVQDFIVFMRGGDSVLGRLVDKAFGSGSSNKLRDVLTRLKDDIVKGFGDGVEAGFKVLWAKVKAGAEEGASEAGAAIIDLWANQLPAAAEQGAAKIRAGQGTWADYAVFIAQQLSPGGILINLAKLGKETLRIGKDAATNLIDGLVSGLEDGYTRLGDAVTKLAENGIKTQLGISLENHSPSHFARRQTRMFGEGGALGLLDMAPRIGQAAKTMIEPARVAVAGVGSASVSQTNYNTFHYKGGSAGPQEIRDTVSRTLAEERDAAYEALTAIV